MNTHNPASVAATVTMGLLAGLLLFITAISAGEWECRNDDDCAMGKCFFKSDGNIGRCAEWKPVVENNASLRKADTRGIAAKQPGDGCAFTVDCLPGYSCYLMSLGSPLGKCLPDTEARYEMFPYETP